VRACLHTPIHHKGAVTRDVPLRWVRNNGAMVFDAVATFESAADSFVEFVDRIRPWRGTDPGSAIGICALWSATRADR